ncbi:MAG: GntR family transcriptional regulator [Clostridiaceae bacterium]
MNINFNDREPIYIQIIRYFKQQMVIGSLKPGDEIPSRRELAGLLKVNANTVQRAYKEMEDMGMIETFRNFQSTVTTNEEIIKNMKEELINDAVNYFISSVKAINVSKNEILGVLDRKWKE